MSPSDPKPARGEADLVAFGDPGVEIQIVDANYQVLARGTGELRKRLPEGIYMVDWTSSGQTAQKLVRLLPIPEPLEVRPDAGTSPVFPAISPDDIGQPLGQLPQDYLRPSERDYGSEVLVVTRASDPRSRIDLSIGLRLINSADVSMRSDPADLAEEQQQITDGYAARLYHVPAGNFSLRYIAMTGETLEQTVPAMKRRRSVVFMSAGTGTVLMAEAGAYKPVEYHGIDPTRTIVVSVPRSDVRPDLTETTRLAGILLHDLAAGSGSLGSAFNAALDAVDADPLLKLYGASVVLSRLEQDVSPAIDDVWPADPAQQNEFRARWHKRAAGWVTAASEQGAPPDLIAAAWRLQAVGETVPGKSRSLTSPPMLECAWRWAVARSARDAKAVPTTASFRAAARTGGGTAPWLSWQPAAAKAQIAPVPAGRNDDLDSLIFKVANRVRAILDSPLKASDVTLSDPLSFLSPDAQAMAFHVIRLTDSRSSKHSRGGDVDPAKKLAALFGAPAPQLKRRLIRTLGELDAYEPASPTRASGLSEQRANLEPPAMRRMIVSKDDPNKGRFGRRRSRGGFELRAEFTPTFNKNWIRITLTVATSLELSKDAIVEFFLHDSFRPMRSSKIFGILLVTFVRWRSGLSQTTSLSWRCTIFAS